MGSALKYFLPALLILVGCGRMSDETVREKDEERIAVSKNMPGNDIPPDPADGR